MRIGLLALALSLVWHAFFLTFFRVPKFYIGDWSARPCLLWLTTPEETDTPPSPPIPARVHPPYLSEMALLDEPSPPPPQRLAWATVSAFSPRISLPLSISRDTRPLGLPETTAPASPQPRQARWHITLDRPLISLDPPLPPLPETIPPRPAHFTVRVVHPGAYVSAFLTRSSGSAAFDRAARNALRACPPVTRRQAASPDVTPPLHAVSTRATVTVRTSPRQ